MRQRRARGAPLSGDDLHVLAEEQAALRRVATLVARGAAPDEVLAAVLEEVGRLPTLLFITNETYVPVSLNNQFHVDVQFTTADLLLSMDLFKTRVIKPMMATVANRIDSDGAYFGYQNTAASFGTPGVSPSSYLTFANANALLDSEECPTDGERVCLLDPFSAQQSTSKSDPELN